MKINNMSFEFFLAKRKLNIAPIEIVYSDSFGNRYNFPCSRNVLGEVMVITIASMFIRHKNKWYTLNKNNEIDFNHEVSRNDLSCITSFESLGINEDSIIVAMNDAKVSVYIAEEQKIKYNQLINEFSKTMSIFPDYLLVD